MNRYGMEVVGIEQGYRGLIENKYHILTEQDLSGILARGGTILGASREKPFKDRGWRNADGSGAVDCIKKNYKDLRLDCLAVLGGNGSQTTADMLVKEGLNIIGIPKTIDNDIVHNDMSFGFHTALDIATDAIDRLHTTAASHNRIMVIEIMGHKAGWLALYAGIAGGSDVIIIPEIPYRIEAIAEHLQERRKKGKNFSVIAVAEGAVSLSEKDMNKKALKEARKSMVGSIGYRVAGEIEAATGADARVTVLGYLQRGGTPSGYDRILATRCGAAAAGVRVRVAKYSGAKFKQHARHPKRRAQGQAHDPRTYRATRSQALPLRADHGRSGLNALLLAFARRFRRKTTLHS